MPDRTPNGTAFVLLYFYPSPTRSMCNCFHHRQNEKNGIRWVCFECREYRKNRGVVRTSPRLCSLCGKRMQKVDCRFEPPKRQDKKEWARLNAEWCKLETYELQEFSLREQKYVLWGLKGYMYHGAGKVTRSIPLGGPLSWRTK